MLGDINVEVVDKVVWAILPLVVLLWKDPAAKRYIVGMRHNDRFLSVQSARPLIIATRVVTMGIQLNITSAVPAVHTNSAEVWGRMFSCQRPHHLHDDIHHSQTNQTEVFYMRLSRYWEIIRMAPSDCVYFG